MRLLVLAGNRPNHLALSHILHERLDVAGIVLSENVPRRRASPRARIGTAWSRIAGRTVGARLTAAWQELQERYARLYPEPPPVAVTRVRNINDPATLRAVDAAKPDLLVVSGTNIVGREILSRTGPTLAALNLHTGISPYIKGGPNCTNWCLAEGRFELIGSTVMWIDAGIDTGAIAATERAPLVGSETLSELHWKVMTHAHELYSRAVDRLNDGDRIPRVPQSSIAPGRTYYTSEWGPLAMRRALRNFDQRYRAFFSDQERIRTAMSHVTLVPLEPA